MGFKAIVSNFDLSVTFLERKVTKRTFHLAHYLLRFCVYPPMVKSASNFDLSVGLLLTFLSASKEKLQKKRRLRKGRFQKIKTQAYLIFFNISPSLRNHPLCPLRGQRKSIVFLRITRNTIANWLRFSPHHFKT